MTIQQLQYILEVQRTGSITKAAKNLFISHSSVSNAIAALEKELGFSIFSRDWRGVTPTKQGYGVLKHASYVFEHLQLIREGTSLADEKIRIETGAYPTFSDSLVRLMEEYRNRGDLTFYHQIYNDTDSAVNKLVRFELDLVVLTPLSTDMHKFKNNSSLRNLDSQIRGTIPAVIRIGPGHRLYDCPTLTPEDFKDEVIVDSPNGILSSSGAMKALIGFDPARALLIADRNTRFELVRKGFAFNIGRLMPEYVNRQYGFRNIPIPGLQYHVVSLTSSSRPVKPEIWRYLSLLDEGLSRICM